MRAAMVMSPDKNGIFDTLLGLVRKGLGGTAGSGRQYISWIHEQDFIRSVNFLIEREDISGAVNIAAPGPLPNSEFMRILRKAAGVSIGLPAMEWMLKLGAMMMRSETELILKSRRVIPGRLLENGFKFDFPDWDKAAKDLCEKWRERKI
jgi:NAD dependent epimerase/dehydratase family enzyme